MITFQIKWPNDNYVIEHVVKIPMKYDSQAMLHLENWQPNQLTQEFTLALPIGASLVAVYVLELYICIQIRTIQLLNFTEKFSPLPGTWNLPYQADMLPIELSWLG